MSDFLFSTRRRAPGELAGVLAGYLAPVSPEVREWHGEWGSLAVARFTHDAPDDVVEDGGWLTVLAGDPVVRMGAEPAGRARQGTRRRAVHQLLRGPAAAAWDERLDGGFAVLAVETGGEARGMVLSDIGGFIPLFWSGGGRDTVVGTHLDTVARAAGRTAVDPVSAAALLATLACPFPHTLYAGVEQFPPAAARGLAADGWSGDAEPYWQPAETNPYASVDEAAAALRDALVEDVHAAVRGETEAGLLLSGGEDARIVLGAVPAEVRVRAFVFADWENREVRVARAAARAYGAELVFGGRAPDHYEAGFRQVASLIGGHNLAIDVHGWGFHERLGIRGLPVVLGGFSADSLLKGNYAGRGGPVSIRLAGVRPELLAEAARRHEAYRERLRPLRPESFDEWSRLWPMGGRKHAGNVDGNRRLFASHEPFHANAVVKLAAAVPLEWKRRRRLFHAAARPLLRPAWYVPHARSRFPYFGAPVNVPLGGLLRAGRGLRDLARGELRARQGPWPKWSTLSGSAATRRLWDEIAPLQTALGDVFQERPAAEVEASVRGAWHPLQQMMLLQLASLARAAAGDP